MSTLDIIKEKAEIQEIASLIIQLTPDERKNLKRGLVIGKAIFGSSKSKEPKEAG